MTAAGKRNPVGRGAIFLGATLAALALGACGGDDSAGDTVPNENGSAEPTGDYVVQAVSCPESFSLADDAPDSAPIDFSISEGEDGSSSWEASDTVDVACLADADGDPFPFVASEIEFTLAPDLSLSGSATWSDSVGLSMNALISGSADDPAPDEINLELTAPSGTLSEMTLASG